MKMSIEWHKGCLKNRKTYIEQLKEKIKRQVAELTKDMIETTNYEDQINLAEKKGLAAFDSEKFGKKKGKIQ